MCGNAVLIFNWEFSMIGKNKTMKIALIRFAQRERGQQIIPWHFGFYKDILSADGHSVTIFDNDIEREPIDALAQKIILEGYDLIATGGICTVYNDLKELCVTLKEKCPAIFIVVGGQIVADTDFILRALPIDVIVCGEGEITLKKIVDARITRSEWQKVPGIAYSDTTTHTIHRNPAEEMVALDELPMLNLEHFDLDQYASQVTDDYLIDARARELQAKGSRALFVFLGRGCPYHCFFCYRQLPGYRMYSDEKIEELLLYILKYNVHFINIGDECLTADKNRLKTFAQLAKKYDIYWKIAGGRVDHVSDELLAFLRAHNCVTIQYGVESFDPDMLKAMNKRTTAGQNIAALNATYRHDINTTLQLIIGSPGENRKTVLNTRKGMWRSFFKHDKIACAVLSPYPGSDAYSYAVSKGFISDKESVHQQFAEKSKLVVNLSALSVRELEAWKYWLHVEAALSYRVKKGKLLLNRALVQKIKSFMLRYVLLAREPLHCILFSVYLCKGFTYWFSKEKDLV